MTEATATFTPGPWTVSLGQYDADNDGARRIMRGTPDDDVYSRIGSASSRIEHNRKTPYNAPDDERDANARLIAAAPEMYKALREAVSHHLLGNPPWLGQARAVLAKAEGA